MADIPGTGRALGALQSNLKDIDSIQMNSGGKAGFFGKAPVSRPSVTWRNTTTATTTTNKVRINRIYAALESLGLIVTT